MPVIDPTDLCHREGVRTLNKEIMDRVDEAAEAELSRRAQVHQLHKSMEMAFFHDMPLFDNSV